jgi:hypothetical protein
LASLIERPIGAPPAAPTGSTQPDNTHRASVKCVRAPSVPMSETQRKRAVGCWPRTPFGCLRHLQESKKTRPRDRVEDYVCAGPPIIGRVSLTGCFIVSALRMSPAEAGLKKSAAAVPAVFAAAKKRTKLILVPAPAASAPAGCAESGPGVLRRGAGVMAFERPTFHQHNSEPPASARNGHDEARRRKVRLPGPDRVFAELHCQLCEGGPASPLQHCTA